MNKNAYSRIAWVSVILILITLLSGCGTVDVQGMLYGEWTYISNGDDGDDDSFFSKTEGLTQTYIFSRNGTGTHIKQFRLLNFGDNFENFYYNAKPDTSSDSFSYSIGDGKIEIFKVNHLGITQLDHVLEYELSGNKLNLFYGNNVLSKIK